MPQDLSDTMPQQPSGSNTTVLWLVIRASHAWLVERGGSLKDLSFGSGQDQEMHSLVQT